MAFQGTAKIWFTVAELAGLALPGLPSERSRMAHHARDNHWADREDAAQQPMARPRAGRGGGMEYNVGLLPPSAVLELVRRGLLDDSFAPANETSPAGNGHDTHSNAYDWTWFEAQNLKTRDEAQRRLKVIQDVEAMAAAGLRKDSAVGTAAKRHDVSKASIYNWFTAIEGVAAADRLPALAPRFKGGGKAEEVHPDVLALFASDFLRPEEPSFEQCYRRLQKAVGDHLPVPSLRVLKARIRKEYSPQVIIALRKGMDAAMKSLPPQERTVGGMRAMECLNIDGHKWDVTVRWPATDREPEYIGRPITVAMQDVYSRKYVGWQTGKSETSEITRLAFAAVFAQYGLPDHVLMDNGRAFASKPISGGAKTRYRFKIMPHEANGLLVSLGIQNHWATPGRGQSKPIERSFGPLEEIVCRHPIMSGAYVGNHIDNKPDNYGSKVIDIDVFEEMLAAGIAELNAREGRRTEMAKGKLSVDQVFEESFRASAPRWATEEQLALALHEAQEVRAERHSGAIRFMGNRYWSEEMNAMEGQRITVRYNPTDLMQPLRVYRPTGEFVCKAEIIEAQGFLDVAAAKMQAKLVANHRKAIRAEIEAANLLSARELAGIHAPGLVPTSKPQRPKVVRTARFSHSAAVAVAEPANTPSEIADLNALFGRAVERVAAQRGLTVIEGGLET